MANAVLFQLGWFACVLGAARPEIDVKSPAGFPPAFDQFFFGGRCDNESNWAGRLDEVAVFDRALSVKELEKLAPR